MDRQSRLLVLLDGSERALDAVHYVASVKNFSSMTVVVLFNVYAQIPHGYLDLERQPEDPDGETEIKSWQTIQEKRRMQYMQRAESILKRNGVENVEIRIRKIIRGVARDILVEARQDYMATVMTRRGMGLLAGLPVGSVAGKLLQNLSSTPIILAPEKACSDQVLIAVDGSEDCMRAVSFAAAMLGKDHRIGLVHVIRNRGDSDFMMTSADTRRIKTDMETAFEKMKAQLVKNGLRPDDLSFKIIDGSSSRAGSILQEAAEEKYDTIVLGRRGLSGTSDFSMGRVSSKIVQMADHRAVWLV